MHIHIPFCLKSWSMFPCIRTPYHTSHHKRPKIKPLCEILCSLSTTVKKIEIVAYSYNKTLLCFISNNSTISKLTCKKHVLHMWSTDCTVRAKDVLSGYQPIKINSAFLHLYFKINRNYLPRNLILFSGLLFTKSFLFSQSGRANHMSCCVSMPFSAVEI